MARAPRDGSSQARLTLTDARVLLLFGVCYRCVAIRRRVLRVAIDGVKTGSGVASATEQLVHSKSVAKKLQKIEKTLNIGERSSFKRELKGLGGALRKAMRSVGEHTPTGANKGAVVSSRTKNQTKPNQYGEYLPDVVVLSSTSWSWYSRNFLVACSV